MSVVAITVTYNTPQLIKDSIAAFRKLYPSLPIVIVENSPIGSECYIETQSLVKRVANLKVLNTGRNIGHGPGMDYGIRRTTEQNIIIFDSDTEIKKPVIELLMQEAKENIYGIGQIVTVDENGFNSDKGINYLHPHFALIQRKHYKRFPRFINHGAPCIDTMKKLHRQRDVTIKHFDIGKYVWHKERGTVNVIRKERELRLKAMNL